MVFYRYFPELFLDIFLPVLSKSVMAPCQFVEELLVQRVILLPVSRWHEDVSADVLVHYLTVCRHTAEGHVHVTIKLNGDLTIKSRVYFRSAIYLVVERFHQVHRQRWSKAHADAGDRAAHLFNVPVDIPLSHRVIPPCLHHFLCVHVDADQTVIGDTQHLIFATSFEPEMKKTGDGTLLWNSNVFSFCQ